MMALCTIESLVVGEEEMQLLRGPSSILMVKLTKSQSWWWRWKRAANSRSSFLLQGQGNLALSAAFRRVMILSLSCQAFSEPAAMPIVREVLPGTSHDSVLYVVLGPKRWDRCVRTPWREQPPEGPWARWASAPSTPHLSAGRLPKHSLWASLGRTREAARTALCRKTCAILACPYHKPKLLGSLRSHALQAGQTQLS